MKKDVDPQERQHRKRMVLRELVAKTKWSVDDNLETRAIGTLHPSVVAMQVARDALAEYEIPEMNLRYAGTRHLGAYDSKLGDGIITINADLFSASGVRQQVEIPVIVHDGQVVKPEVLIHEGQTRVLAQSTFDDIIHRGDIFIAAPERESMYSRPGDNESDSLPTQLSHQRGWNDINRSAALSDLDPAERNMSEYLQPGEEVEAADGLYIHMRGGSRIAIPAGTKGVVIRDMFGDDSAYYVEFESYGKLPVSRKDLR